MHRLICVGLCISLAVSLSQGCAKKPATPSRVELPEVNAAGQGAGEEAPAAHPASGAAGEAEQPDLSGIRVAIIIAPKGFRDEEFLEPYNALKDAGAEVTVVSMKKGECKGAGGATAEATATPDEIDPDEYAAVVFVGGPGMYKLLDNEKLIALAKKFGKDEEKIIAAICVSPAILANAGLLDGVRATSWKDVQPILAAKGAEVIEDEDVVVSGRFITANGPKAAPAYARAIVAALAAKKTKKAEQ